MALDVYPARIQADATARLVFSGPPNRAITWALSGAGTLTNVDPATNSLGLAQATFRPSAGNQVARIEVSYVV